MRGAWLAMALVACTGVPIEERQQAALEAAEQAVPTALVVAELLQHSTEEPDPETTVTGARHAGDCGCPCISVVGTTDSYVQELDYEQPSCLPESDLLPARIGGHAWIDYDRGDVSIDRVQAWLAPRALPDEQDAISADLQGSFEGKEDLWEATVSGAASAGGHEASFTDLFIDLGRDVRFDGEIGGGRMVDLALPRRAEDAPCPLPESGSFELDEAVVTWSGDRMMVDVEGEVLEVDTCERMALP